MLHRCRRTRRYRLDGLVRARLGRSQPAYDLGAPFVTRRDDEFFSGPYRKTQAEDWSPRVSNPGTMSGSAAAQAQRSHKAGIRSHFHVLYKRVDATSTRHINRCSFAGLEAPMTMHQLGLVLAMAAATTACGASTRSTQTASTDSSLSSLIDENAENEDKAVIANKPRECESDNECCDGFYCGRDPQISEVIKVCMSSGQ
jgi:hypothetical protein